MLPLPFLPTVEPHQRDLGLQHSWSTQTPSPARYRVKQLISPPKSDEIVVQMKIICILETPPPQAQMILP